MLIHKKKKYKTYNFRIGEDEERMIKTIRECKVDVSSMLRKHIRDIYNEVIKIKEIDDNIYGL